MQILFRLILVAMLPTTVWSVVWAAEKEKHSLQYRFQKGDVMEWNVQQSLRMTLSVQGKTEVTETVSRSTKIWTVLNVSEDGVATFEYKVGNVHMKKSQTDRKDEQYDSRVDKEVPVAFITLEGAIGVPLAELSIDPLGEMKKKKVLSKYSGAYEENRIAIPLPKEPIAVGERWSMETPMEIRLAGDGTVKRVQATQRFTLDSVETGVAKISFRTIILTPDLTPQLQSQIIDKRLNGTLTLDLDNGRLISQQTTVDEEVIGFQGGASRIHHLARFTECCCGLKSCEICQ